MDLLLEEGGAVTGQEKGRTMRSRKCVNGVIIQGKWGVNGKLEFDYVFQDGTVFVYTGDIDMGLGRCVEPRPGALEPVDAFDCGLDANQLYENCLGHKVSNTVYARWLCTLFLNIFSCRYEGRWFVKAAGWDASDENNKGWFAFDFSSPGMYFNPLCEEDLATMRSLKSFLQVVHNCQNGQESPVEIILRGNTVETVSIVNELVHPVPLFCADMPSFAWAPPHTAA